MPGFSLWVWGCFPDKETDNLDGSLLRIFCAHLGPCLHVKIRTIWNS